MLSVFSNVLPRSGSIHHNFVQLFSQNVIKDIEGEEFVSSNADGLDENAIMKLQALARGYLLRKKIAGRYSHFHDNIDKIQKIQAWWRGARQRRIYAKMIETRLRGNIERVCNYSRIRTKYQNAFDRYREHVRTKNSRPSRVW